MSASIPIFARRLFCHYFNQDEMKEALQKKKLESGRFLRLLDPVRLALIRKHVADRLGRDPSRKLWTECVHRMSTFVYYLGKRKIKDAQHTNTSM